jgi:hypothetical protein
VPCACCVPKNQKPARDKMHVEEEGVGNQVVYAVHVYLPGVKR